MKTYKIHTSVTTSLTKKYYDENKKNLAAARSLLVFGYNKSEPLDSIILMT